MGLVCVALFCAPAIAAEEHGPLVLSQTIVLPHVRGRIDHLDIDILGARLFVAARGNDTVEIVDLRQAKSIERLDGLRAPQGVVYMPLTGRLFVSNGRSGNVQALAGTPFAVAARIDRLDDADNMRFDAERGALYIGYGNALAEIDAATASVASHIKLAGHPESFQLEQRGPRIFANVPEARQIAVIDRDRQAQIDAWQLEESARNFAMALDEESHRLFVGTRQPPAIVVYDTDSGKRISEIAIGGDVDDLFYDPERKQIYAVCGEGIVNVVRQRNADRYESVGQLTTAPGARTGLYVRDISTLYVAVPARGANPAEIRVYKIR